MMTHIATTKTLTPAELADKWMHICKRLRAELGEDLYTSWFGRMDADSLSDNRLTVSVPTRFLKGWIENHYLKRLHAIAAAELGALDYVVVKVRTNTPINAPVSAAATAMALLRPQPLPTVDTQANPTAPSTAAPSLAERSLVPDDNLTFENFVVGMSNQLAHAAAQRVAQASAASPVSFNPLYIHSAAGFGKTHLLNAIMHRVKGQPGRRAMMLTAERFMYWFIQALRQRDTIAFKDQFQSIDVLLIDDFQFLQGKTMQQEFCHAFNSLVDSKRQVVIAADVPPGQLDMIDQRMRSRLLGGLVVDIETPEADLRKRILLARHATLFKDDPAARIPDAVIDLIAARVTGGGRELEGALNKVVAYQQFNQSPITLDLAGMVLRESPSSADQGRIKIEDILKIVGRHYNVAKADLLSPRRARTVVVPRQIGMYLAKKLTSRSLPEIGRRFGGRDHSTVLHAVRKVDDQIRKDDKMAREVALLIRLVEQQ
jgi:chromosomal replication initiator protein